jgi:hypothetical protein
MLSHIEIDKLKDTVMCDVLPLKFRHILWVSHGYGIGTRWRANTYSFVDGNKKYTLTCAKDMPILKLKKCSFLIWKIVPSDDILGVAPNSMESSPFQRGRIDAAAMEWLEKQYPLWKSKAKANPKNKFPWYILYLLILESRVFK